MDIAVVRELREALLRWRNASIAKMESTNVHWASVYDSVNWKAEYGGICRLHLYRAHYNISLLEKHLMQLDEWVEVMRIVDANDELKSHIGKFISVGHAGFAFQMYTFASGFLPEIVMGVGGQPLFDTSAGIFEEQFNNFINMVTSSEMEVVTLWPIQGLSLDVDSLRLDDDVAIVKISSNQLADLMTAGTVQLLGPSVVVSDDLVRLYGLEFRKRYPKVLGNGADEKWDIKANEVFENDQKVQDAFICSVSLAGIKRVVINGNYKSTAMSDLGSYFSYAFPTVDASFSQATRPVGRNQQGDISDLWKKIRWLQSHKSGNLMVACMRFGAGFQQVRPGVRFLDLMIAAEALYLERVRSELVYQLAIRAGLWASNNPGSIDSNVFKMMKKCYDIRSRIVHGDNFGIDSVVYVEGEEYRFNELVEEVCGIIRDAIVKALAYCHDQKTAVFKPEWDNMLLDAD